MLIRLAAGLLVHAQAPSSVPPNVVFILLDDVGRDKVGAYADHPHPAPTPNLDALAARGVLFRHAWAYPTCSPTRASVLTGRHPDRHGIGLIIQRNDGVETFLDPDEVLLPEALPAHSNIALGKWHLRDRETPYTHAQRCGFDRWVGYVGPNDYECWTRYDNGSTTSRSGYYPFELAADTIRVLREMPEPYFAYVCPRLAHWPYHDPPDGLHSQGNPSFPIVQHIAMVEAADTILGRVMQHVDLDDTFVFVMGDNGSPGATVSAPFDPFHAKGSMYEDAVRVPLIVAGPGVRQGVEVGALVQATDVFATVLELVGAPPADGFAEDSVSFAPLLLTAGAQGAREWVYTTRFMPPGVAGQRHRAVRTARHKLIHRVDANVFELYDLATDPFEGDNLLLSNPGACTDALRDRLAALIPTFP